MYGVIMDPVKPVAPLLFKGDRIRSAWFATRLTCLAGVQTKFGATLKRVTGVVRHIRVDDPVTPTEIRIYIDPDDGYAGSFVNPPGCTCSTRHVEIRPEWVEAKI